MTSDFAFFEGSRNEGATDPTVTVRWGGVLVLTPATVEMLGEDVESVQIGFNPKTRALGIRGSGEGEPRELSPPRAAQEYLPLGRRQASFCTPRPGCSEGSELQDQGLRQRSRRFRIAES